MDPIVITIVMRFVERLIVVLGACLALYCGYKLFLAMPSREHGAGKLDLPGGVSIHISRVGPGVFFSLFGAVILAMSFHYGVAVEIPTSVKQQSDTADSSKALARTTFSGIGGSENRGPGPNDIFTVSLDVSRLNLAASAIDPKLDSYLRRDIQRSLHAAKLALMRATWSEAEWGDRAAFTAWIEAGEPMPPPDAIARAVEVYLAKP